MYIDRGALKRNAKNIMSRSYWSCVLTGIVLALATGSIGNSPSTTNYGFNNTSDSGNSFFGGEIHGYRSTDLFGGILSDLNYPTYTIGTLMTMAVIILVLSFVIAIFLFQPLEVGCRKFYIDAQNDDHDLSDMGAAFSENYTNIVKIMFLRGLYTFLWSLLFIIPGIVKSYEYRMIPYILAENPGISGNDAFMASRQMMTGSKFDAFVFDLSFLGWFILDSLSFGILGIFYVNPYYYNACAGLYAFLKAKPVYGQQSYYSSTYDNGSSYQYDQGYQTPAKGYETGGSETAVSDPEGTTTSADDAKPFRVPYGQ